MKPPSPTEQSAPLLVHLLRNMKQGGSLTDVKQKLPELNEEKPKELGLKKPVEEVKSHKVENDIQEEIIEEIVDEHNVNFGGKDDQEGVGASSTSMGVD